MPCLTYQISDKGPVIDLLVGVSEPRRKALHTANKSIPKPVRVRGLIDTGASSTCIDPSVVGQLELTPTGTIHIHTPSTGANLHSCNQYDASITLVHPQLAYTVHTAAVIESNLSNQGIFALIGRDVLQNCLFVYNGNMGFFTLAF